MKGRAPLASICCSLIIGCFLGKIWEGCLLGFVVVIVAIWIGGNLFYSKQLFPFYEYSMGLVIHLAMMALGAWVVIIVHSRALIWPQLEGQRIRVQGVVEAPVRWNEFGERAWLRLTSYMTQDCTWYPLEGKIRIRVPPTTCFSLFEHTQVDLTGKLSPIKTTHKGYRQYLWKEQIHYKMYIKQGHSMGVVAQQPSAFQQLQAQLGEQFERGMQDSVAQSMAKAIFLGDKQDLPSTLRTSFSHAGMSHILAISGLHVGIIYLLLDKLLAFFHLFMHGKRIKYGVILGILIGYALLTGASPAVVRTVLIFSIVLLAKIFYLKYSILNLLAFSAILQLVYNPFVLWDIGFQLSYTAVLGIILLYPTFMQYVKMLGRHIRIPYSWIAVSMSAQLATAPLVYGYFGIFPTYFLLTNMLVVPLASVVIWLGVGVCATGGIPVLHESLCYLCEQSLLLLRTLSQWIASLPYSVITHWDWTSNGVWILLAQLGGVILLWTIPSLSQQYQNYRARQYID